MKQRNKLLIVISAISCIIFMFLVIYNSDEQSDKQFFVGAYYVGDRGVTSNPKDMYNKMYSSYDNIVQCSDEPKSSGKVKRIGNKLWLFETDNDIDASYIESYATTDVDGNTVYRFTDYSDTNIVAPASVTFLSSNVEMVGGSSIMSIQLGTDYRFDLTNVVWWCHLDRDNPSKHTEVIGKDGKFSSLSAGTVIGRVTEDTVLIVYKLSEDGTLLNCSLSEYYFE